MTIEEALKILQINGTDVTKEEIYNSFRKLSKIYHPDKGGDSQKFIRVHAAYEFLNKNFNNIGGDTNFETYDSIEELDLRIIDVKKAFENLHRRYQIEIENMINNLYAGTYKIIDNYESKDELKKNLYSDINNFLKYQIKNFQSKLNNGIIEIINNYDNWLFDTFRNTYKFLKKENLKYFYKSKFFYLIVILNFFIFSLSINYIFSSSYKTYLVSLIFCLFLSPIIYFFYIDSKYNFNKNIEFINKNKIKIDFFSPNINVSEDITDKKIFEFGKGLGMFSGIALASLIASSLGLALAPLGVLFGIHGGRIFGSIIDGIFGKSLKLYKKEAKQAVSSVIDDISRNLITSLNAQFPQVMQNLIQTMEENYKNNKAKTIKLLLNKN